ncbi:YfbU family protein [uncultured Brevundimonas sp.]|uniref:YfbU family protein n=1 Tax=uncultured Brevundimonas sp. TaxID=213418 RepID=UPI0025CF6623|nr:YfbU family protein [uncultured Brevundimonas sp.]
MKTTQAEKLILLMLAEVLEGQKAGKYVGEIDATFVKNAIYYRHGWAFDWQMSMLIGQDDSDVPAEVAKEVADHLEMWSYVERSFQQMSGDLQASLREEDGVYGDPAFPGYDGNNEGQHFSVAKFLVEHMGRFGEFAGRDMNSHHPSVDRYRAMNVEFRRIQKERGFGAGLLDAGDLLSILRAGNAA